MLETTFDTLEQIVSQISCKPGWDFTIEKKAAYYWRLVIAVQGWDSYDETIPLTVSHYFPVPIATYNDKAWRRWLFECCRGVENHELGEWFKVDGHRPFAPLHGPGENPYVVHEFRDEIDARTNQTGSARGSNVLV